MEVLSPAAADVRAGPYGGGVSPEAGRPRGRSSVCLAGPGSDSYCARYRGGAGGPASAHAPLSQSAYVAGGCLSGPAIGTRNGRRSPHPGLGFSHLPPPWEQGDPGSDAGLNCGIEGSRVRDSLELGPRPCVPVLRRRNNNFEVLGRLPGCSHIGTCCGRNQSAQPRLTVLHHCQPGTVDTRIHPGVPCGRRANKANLPGSPQLLTWSVWAWRAG